MSWGLGIIEGIAIAAGVLLGFGMVLAVLFVVSLRRHYRELDRAEQMETTFHLVQS